MGSLFHYTGAAGLLGVTSDLCLWASDVRFLNDSQELIYAHAALVDAIRSMDNPVRGKGHQFHGTDLEESGAELWENFRESVLKQVGSSGTALYVTCFCGSGDLLSQWRGYGGSQGYALEFDPALLAESLGRSPYRTLVPVSYGSEIASEVFREAMSHLTTFNLSHPGMKAHHAALLLNGLLARIKHPGFREEDEWRIIVAADVWENSSQAAGNEVLFRPSPTGIVPYVPVRFPPEALKSVRVGPGSNIDVREDGVRRLLKSLGLGADVLRSDVPLRG